MASNRRDVLLRIRSEGIEETKGDVRTMRDELSSFGRTEATARIDVKTAAVEQKLADVQKRLERLSRQEATPAVRLAMGRAVEQLDKLEFKLERLKHERVEIDVDIKRGALERTTGALGSVERLLGRLSSGIGGVPFIGPVLAAPFKLIELFAAGLKQLPQLLENVGQVATSAFQTVADTLRDLGNGTTTIGQVLGSIFSSLASTVATGGLALLALIPIVGALSVALSALASAIVSVIGTLGALIASLAFALAGAGALAVTLGAVVAPALLVLGAFIKQFIGVLQARKQAEQQTTQAAQAQRAADERRRQTVDQLRQAEQNLAAATVAGRKAAAQAIVDERNAQLSLQDSQLGLKSARLNVLDARKQLRDLISTAGVAGPALNALVKKFSSVDFDPSKAGRVLGAIRGAGGHAQDPLALAHAILNVQQAQQGVKDAVNQTANAERALSDATQRRVQFAREGLRAYQPYVAALRQVRQAEERVQVAQDKAAQAQARYNTKLRELSTTQRGFLAALDPFLKKLGAVADIVTRPIFDGMAKALGSIAKIVGDSRVQAGFTAIGQAIGGFIAQFARTLSTEQWRAAIAGFARDAARFIGQAGKGFGYLSTVLSEIAQTAMPALIKMARDVATWLGRIASKPGEIHNAVKFVVDQFKIWLSIAGHLGSIVLGFLKAARGSSSSLSTSIDHLVAKFDHWINSKRGMRDVREFLRQSVAHVKSMGDKLPGLLKQFIEIAKVVGTIARDTIKVVQWLGNARRNTEHAITGGGGLSQRELIAARSAIDKDTALLHTHLAPAQRDAVRERLFENLNNLAKHWVDLAPPLKDLLNRLRKITGHSAGGFIGGSGSGDSVPALLEPGEFVLRRAVVRQLSLPVVAALNGGVVPRLAASPAATGTTNIFNNEITVPGGGPPDPRTLAAKLERELRLAG